MNIVMPNYEHSVLNTITSILKYYGVETKYKTLSTLDKYLGGNKKYKNVILLVMDGMGEHIINSISPDGFLNNNKKTVATAVYPSTTTASLTTYYAGKPPYETGWIAWSQYFKELGRNVDLLQHTESYELLPLKGTALAKFRELSKYKTIFEQIKEASPETEVFEVTPEYSERRSYNTLTADNIDEIIDNINILMKLPSNTFIMAYSDKPDGTLHKFGTDSDEAREYLLYAEKRIEEFANDLPEDTLLIISADHGHRNIDKAYTILDYPDLWECLIIPPSLESRVVSFLVKEDMKETFEERFNSKFKDEFWLMTKEEFLEKKFLGEGKKHPKLDDFLGNYIAISIGGSMIRLETFFAEGKPIKKSTHAGLTKEEMEIPVIIIEK